MMKVAEMPAMTSGGLSLQQLTNPSLDPSLFVPVCGFSDGFYRTAKNFVYTMAGAETYQVSRWPCTVACTCFSFSLHLNMHLEFFARHLRYSQALSPRRARKLYILRICVWS